MKFLLLLSSIIFLNSCNTTIRVFEINDKDKLGVKSFKFRATIFKSTYPQEKLIINTIDTLNRFTPSINEIKLAELILQEQIKTQRTGTHLNRYFRQYVGFINKDGEKIIHINLYRDKYSLIDRLKSYNSQSNKYSTDFMMIIDGGYNYWNTNVNLKEHILERPKKNGIE